MKITRTLPKFLFLLFIIAILLVYSCTERGAENQSGDRVILGIFGGMGPEATADLYRLIVELTPAERDQDHIPTLIYSLPQVPDRMTSIRNQDLSIIPYLTEGVTRLEKAGASFIAIPCNTVHYYFDTIQASVAVPVIHMIRETVKEVTDHYPEIKTVGLLATSGTIETHLYEDELTAKDYRVVLPDYEVQNEKVMKAVYGIKAGTDRKIIEVLLAEAGQHLTGKGAELIILGCTEIPLAFNPSRVEVPVVNATKVLAERAIRMYREMTGK